MKKDFQLLQSPHTNEDILMTFSMDLFKKRITFIWNFKQLQRKFYLCIVYGIFNHSIKLVDSPNNKVVFKLVGIS